MAQSKAFVDASHALNVLSHALALLESENSSLRGAVDGFTNENDKLRELCRDLQFCRGNDCLRCSHGRFCDLRLNERCDELGVTQ